jgi:hypothetical protein
VIRLARTAAPRACHAAPPARFPTPSACKKGSEKALGRVFDRNSASLDRVPAKWLRTVADVLRDYHRQPEYKFLGGGWNEEGILRRRHVFADTIEDIGKESDGWEEDEARTEDEATVLIYPSSSLDRERMIEVIKSVGKRELMREARATRTNSGGGRRPLGHAKAHPFPRQPAHDGRAPFGASLRKGAESPRGVVLAEGRPDRDDEGYK